MNPFFSWFTSGIAFGFFDLVYALGVSGYIFVEASSGSSIAFKRCASIILSTLCSFVFYVPVSSLLLANLVLSKGLTDGIVFLFLTVFFYLLFLIAFNSFFSDVFLPGGVIGRIIASLFGLISILIILLNLTIFTLSFPISNALKHAILDSYIGNKMSELSFYAESPARLIFGSRNNQMNLVVLEPLSEEEVNLRIHVNSTSEDENLALSLSKIINSWRIDKHREELQIIKELNAVAQGYTSRKFLKGEISLYSSGVSVVPMLLENAGILPGNSFGTMLCAQDPEGALKYALSNYEISRFLMSENISRLGISVLDGGTFGYLIMIIAQ